MNSGSSMKSGELIVLEPDERRRFAAYCRQEAEVPNAKGESDG